MKGFFSRRLRIVEDESVNSLDGVANLSDIMIVFSVGLMLALVMNWNLDIGATTYIQEPQGAENTITFEGSNMEDASGQTAEINRSEMERLGTVYYDEQTGKYYIIVE